MKTLEELKQEMEDARADCDAAWDAYADCDADCDAAWDAYEAVWDAARDAYETVWDAYAVACVAYNKKLRELKEDLKIEDKKSKEWE